MADGATQRGQQAEDAALAYLARAGLMLVDRNYRAMAGRQRGEIDLVMRERDGTLVFVEVRARAASGYGGAAGSITRPKQQRVVLAAQHYLQRLAQVPPCRFDVVAIEAGRIEWIRNAFEAG